MSRRDTNRALPWLCAVLFACVSISQVHAQSPDDERARVHFVAGEAYFSTGQWSDAAREFGQAYQLSGRPEMLINLSRAHERGGALEEAIADLALLLERHPQTAYRSEAEQRMAHMQSQLDQKPTLPGPDAAPIQAAPASTADHQTPRALWPPRLPTLVMGGSAVALGIGALITGLFAHTKHAELEDSCPGDVCASRYNADRTRGKRLARTSTGLSFAALLLAGGTAALWFWDVRTARTERATFDLRLDKGHAEARLGLTF